MKFRIMTPNDIPDYEDEISEENDLIGRYPPLAEYSPTIEQKEQTFFGGVHDYYYRAFYIEMSSLDELIELRKKLGFDLCIQEPAIDGDEEHGISAIIINDYERYFV